MGHDLISDPGVLRRQLERLAGTPLAAGEKGDHAEARAECCFRLAVHPETRVEEAVELLRRAIRLDGSHPKYAYHLGRLYLVHDQHDAARKWLSLAHRLCPTSHRIWCHISILQRRLNLRYRGESQYVPDGLRTRADKLVQSILSGENILPDPLLTDLDPPLTGGTTARPEEETSSREDKVDSGGAAPAAGGGSQRSGSFLLFTAPRGCRWSGVGDLQVEQLLEREPTQRNLRLLRPKLEEIAEQIADKPAGASRFAVIAIQWLIAGYPVETIRKLAARHLVARSPSRSLLNLLCGLYESTESDLPSKLSDALRDGRLPAVVAAIVHHQRLLRRELNFSGFDAYQTARAILDGTTDQRRGGKNLLHADPVELSRECNGQLRRAADALGCPHGSVLIDTECDEQEENSDTRDPIEILMHRQHRVQELLERVVKPAWTFVRTDLRPRAEDPEDRAALATVEADRSALAGLVARLEKFVETCQEARADLAARVMASSGTVKTEAALHLEEYRSKLADLGSIGRFTRALTRIGRQVETARESLGPAAATDNARPSAALSEILQQAEKIYGADVISATDDEAAQEVVASRDRPLEQTKDAKPIPADDDPRVAREAQQASSLMALSEAVRSVNARLDQSFDEVEATFDAYDIAQLRLPPLRTLAGSLRDRRARALFRLGRRRSARRLWHNLLSMQGFETAILKNIALCDTAIGDIGRTLNSWNLHLEFLYALDVGIGSPRPHARARAATHRTLADVCAPAFLSAEYKQEWRRKIDQTALLAFFESPGRLKCFVRNKLLQFLNARLDFASPPLILGVARSEGTAARESAHDHLIRYTNLVSSGLAPSVKNAFSSLVSGHADTALEACSSFISLSGRRDHHYTEEEETFRRLLTEFAQLKFKILIAVQANGELVRHMTSVSFLNEFTRLDDIPLGQSAALLRPVAGALAIDIERLKSLMSGSLRSSVLASVLEFVFSDGGADRDISLRERQYRRLVREWAAEPAFREYRDLIDDPQDYYPRVVKAVVHGEGDRTEAIDALLAWKKRYPDLTGPARLVAQLLAKAGRVDAALQVLAEAMARGFHSERVVTCYHDRMLVLWNEKAPRHKPSGSEPSWLADVRSDANYVLKHSQREQEQKNAREILKLSHAGR